MGVFHNFSWWVVGVKNMCLPTPPHTHTHLILEQPLLFIYNYNNNRRILWWNNVIISQIAQEHRYLYCENSMVLHYDKTALEKH